MDKTTKATRPWDGLSREEKIRHLFEYPAEMRDRQAKELWGPKAGGYNEHIYFPPDAPWHEIVEVIKHSHGSQMVYMRLKEKDFMTFDAESRKRERERRNIDRKRPNAEYLAYLEWRTKVLRRSKPEMLSLELYRDNKIICRVCTDEGDYGDEDGFGVEPDWWASAIFDMDGNTIRPFSPGYITCPRDEY